MTTSPLDTFISMATLDALPRGSDQVDTTTVSSFSQIMRAVELLGAKGIIVGIRPHVAQAMTSLDPGLRDVHTYRSLREALSHCIQELR